MSAVFLLVAAPAHNFLRLYPSSCSHCSSHLHLSLFHFFLLCLSLPSSPFSYKLSPVYSVLHRYRTWFCWLTVFTCFSWVSFLDQSAWSDLTPPLPCSREKYCFRGELPKPLNSPEHLLSVHFMCSLSNLFSTFPLPKKLGMKNEHYACVILAIILVRWVIVFPGALRKYLHTVLLYWGWNIKYKLLYLRILSYNILLCFYIYIRVSFFMKRRGRVAFPLI